MAVLPVIDSTNQYLLDRIGELRSGDACVAEYQQAGRGRRGRKWFSPFGANLYLSMYWRLEQGPAAAIGLSLVIGIVMAEVLRELGADKVRVKWPNDLYLLDRKLAGILVELTGKTGDAAQIVIGAGINMAMRRVEEGVINQGWITLQEAGITLDRNMLAAKLVYKLRAALELFEQEGLSPYLSRWKKLDNFIDRPVKLIIGDKEIFGISRGIDTQGALLLEQDGVIKPWMGEKYRYEAPDSKKGSRYSPFFYYFRNLTCSTAWLALLVIIRLARSRVGNIFCFKFNQLISFQSEVAVLTASSLDNFA